eukprot:5269124-Amphidinium_carterae.1
MPGVELHTQAIPMVVRIVQHFMNQASEAIGHAHAELRLRNVLAKVSNRLSLLVGCDPSAYLA